MSNSEFGVENVCTIYRYDPALRKHNVLQRLNREALILIRKVFSKMKRYSGVNRMAATHCIWQLFAGVSFILYSKLYVSRYHVRKFCRYSFDEIVLYILVITYYKCHAEKMRQTRIEKTHNLYYMHINNLESIMSCLRFFFTKTLNSRFPNPKTSYSRSV